MSLQEPLTRDDSFIFGDSRRVSGSLSDVAEFVDPQSIVKRCGTTHLGYMTPETSPTDTTPRRHSFSNTYFCDSSAASSFMSHSGNITPSLATPGSSASNSRRHSMLLPEYEQYYPPATSSSPSHAPQASNETAATDQYPFQGSSPAPYLANTNSTSLISDGVRACVPEGELGMAVDEFIRKAPRQWPSHSPQIDSSSLFRTFPHIDDLMWDYDLMDKINSPIAARPAHALEFSQPFGYSQPSVFDDPPSMPERSAYNLEDNPSPNSPSLQPPLEIVGVKCREDATSGLCPTLRDVFPGPPVVKCLPRSEDDVEGGYTLSRKVKSQKRRHKQNQKTPCEWADYRRHLADKSHRCREPKCDYACNRQEHLKRHESSKHIKSEWYPCAFPKCTDRKTGKQREIASRFDNLKAHYTKTHFSYGSSENGGKNERKSMKAALEKGLRIYDSRWAFLTDNKMDVNKEIEDDKGNICFLHVWKMLGYSILETRDIKVKDVYPEWKVTEGRTADEKLQTFDPRWKALLGGTLTFEKAMDRGKHMDESEAQGLLGVTMLETEAMGIKHLDPRWTMLLSGRMSVEQSEKLGVKQIARRRARCGIEKL